MQLGQLWKVGTLALRNFLLGGNLVSLRWLTNPRQLIGYNAETLFLYKTIARRRGLQSRNVFQVMPAACTANACMVTARALITRPITGV